MADWRALPTYPRIPTANQGGREVFRSSGTPDFKGRDYLFECWL
jgi:hypothetical protein